MKRECARSDELLTLIDSIYAAALDPSQWEALAPRIAAVFGSTSTNLQTIHGGQSHILTVTENIQGSISAYQQYYCARDVWIEGGKKLGLASVVASKDMISDRDFANSEFFRDWCRHLDVFYVVGSVFTTAADEIGVLGIHRPRAAGAYEESDKAAVATFLPHLQRALQVRHQLARTALLECLSFDVLDRTDVAALVVGSEAHVLFANPRAERLLKEGSALGMRDGRLIAVARADLQRLRELIRTAGSLGEDSSCAGGLMTLQQPHRPPLVVLVAPCRVQWRGVPQARALLLIREPNQSICIAAALQQLFRLTSTESRIAEALANGLSLAEIATAQGATTQTVRKQLKSIFAKTGTHRQAQCVSMLLRSIAPLMQGRKQVPRVTAR